MDKQTNMVLIGGGILVAALFIFGIIPLGTTFSILPEGEYYSNVDCSFISNIVFYDPPMLSNYGTTGGWVSVDWDGDGNLEAFGRSGHSLTSTDYCSSRTYIMDAPGGYRLVVWDSNEIAICDSTGNDQYRFAIGDSDATNAILTCDGGGTTGPTCGDGTCDSGEDYTNCPSDCSAPQTGDYCETGCVTDQEFPSLVVKWLSQEGC